MEASPRKAIVTGNGSGVGVGLARVHGGGAVNDADDAAAAADYLVKHGIFDLADDVEVEGELLLVSMDGRRHGIVEVISEV